MRRRLLLLAVFLAAFNAFAAIELGPPQVEVSALAPCPASNARCLAADAGVIVWIEQSGMEKARLRAMRGAKVFDIQSIGGIDHPSVATGGQSFVVVWRQASSRGYVISSAQVTGDAVAPRKALATLLLSGDPPANVTWSGGEFAIALPESLVFLSSGNEVSLATTADTPLGAVAAVNGGSILVVRQLRTPFYSGGSSPEWYWTSGGDFIASATIAGNSATYPIIGANRDQHALAVAAGGDGYLLIWKDAANVRALRLDQEGNAVGPRPVVAGLRRPGGTTAIAATRAGWLAAWDDTLRDGTFVVRAAELDANGNPAGEVVTITGRSPSIVKIAEERFRLFYRTESAVESRVIATSPGRRRAVR